MARNRIKSGNIFLLITLLPAMLILGGFILLFFWGFYQSLTDMRFGRSRVDFEGIENYARLFSRSRFWDSVSATAIYAFSAVI